MRSGTLDVAAIRAFAVAADLAPYAGWPRSRPGWPPCATSWSAGSSRPCRRPSCAATPIRPAGCRATPCSTFPGCEGDSLLYLLDAAGVQCSTGSACQAGVPQPSHVLLAMGVPEDDARGAIRLSLGHTSTVDDVDALRGRAARRRRAGSARRPGLPAARRSRRSG